MNHAVIALADGSREVDLFRPVPSVVRLDDLARALGNLCRFNGHVTRFYSVAEHACLVAHLVEPATPRLRLLALLHDAAEAYLGDVVAPLKRDPRLAWLRDLEDDWLLAVTEALNVVPPTVAEPPTYGEAHAVKRADLAALGVEQRLLKRPACGRAVPVDDATLARGAAWLRERGGWSPVEAGEWWRYEVTRAREEAR